MSWTMPVVEKGMMVRWHPGGDPNEAWLPAMVTQVNDVSGQNARHVHLSIWDVGMQTPFMRDGVRHTDDPSLHPGDKKDSGTWSYTDQHKRFLAMEKFVEEFLTAPAQ